MKFDKQTFTFKSFYFVFLGAVGAFAPYINVYLENSRGLTGSQIGLITSLSLILGVCTMPLWGIVGDRTKKYTALIQFALLASIVAVYFYSSSMVYTAIILSAVGLEVLRIGIMPLADTITSSYTQRTNTNYGSIRAMGSLGYMLCAMAVGFLADLIGLDGPLFAIYAALLFGSFIISFGFPKENNNKEKDKKNKVPIKDLLKNTDYRFILLISLLTSAVLEAAMVFGGNHLVNTLHGSDSMISWLTFITVLPEVVFLAIAFRVIKKIGYKKFYIIAIVSMLVRFLVYAFVSNTVAFLIVSIVHCLGVACVAVGTLTYIQKTVSPAVLGTAITLFNASMALVRAILGYVFGFVYEYSSSYVIFLISSIFFAVALVLVITTKHFKSVE